MSISRIIFPCPKSTYTDSNINMLDSNSVVHFIPSVSVVTHEDILIPVLFMTFSHHEYTYQNYLLFFHGNAEDLGSALRLLKHMRNSLATHIIAVEYPGYGVYKGKPTSDQIKQDALKIYDYLNKVMEIPEDNITVVGRSIGSGPACEVGSKRHPRCVILVSAFTSIKKLSGDLSFGIASYFVKERFNNYESLDTFKSPVLLIHGKADNLIKYQHSQQLEARLETLGKVAHAEYPEEMTHNKFRFEIDLISPIRRFLDRFVPKQMQKIPLDQLPPVFLSFKSFIKKKEYEESQLEQEKNRELQSKNQQKQRLCKKEDEIPAKNYEYSYQEGHSSNEFASKNEQQTEAESPINDITIGEYCTHFNGEYSPKKKQGDISDSFRQDNKPLFLKANSTLVQENQTQQTGSIEKKLPSRTSSSLSLDKKNQKQDKTELDKRDNESKLERSRQIEKYLNYQKKNKCEPCYIHPVKIEEIEEEKQNPRLTRINGNQKTSSIPPKQIDGGSNSSK